MGGKREIWVGLQTKGDLVRESAANKQSGSNQAGMVIQFAAFWRDRKRQETVPQMSGGSRLRSKQTTSLKLFMSGDSARTASRRAYNKTKRETSSRMESNADSDGAHEIGELNAESKRDQKKNTKRRQNIEECMKACETIRARLAELQPQNDPISSQLVIHL